MGARLQPAESAAPQLLQQQHHEARHISGRDPQQRGGHAAGKVEQGALPLQLGHGAGEGGGVGGGSACDATPKSATSMRH
eukprot:908919-Prorocentrum_minimum.AAC.2